MESLLAIGVGLVLRIVIDVATDNDDRVGGVLVGLWEGVVLSHFIRRMPRSFDPYLGFGFRIFVDFLFTQSLSRLALVALWALVGMLLADIAPNVWRDSGLRHLYRQVRKDVRHVKRAVPRIRIKNDLPSVRLFNQSRSTSTEVSGSVRSDRAAPSRSPVPSPAPTPGPVRRPGRSPPGTFPDVSGWSETGTNVSNLRERIVTNPGPSPALIPSIEQAAAYERLDTTHVATSQTRTTTVQDTTITITQTQNESVLLETVVDTTVLGAAVASKSLEPIDDPSRHDPPTIPDDWVDVTCPVPVQLNEPITPFQPDPGSTPEHQPGPSILTRSRPASVYDPPPVIDVLPDIPNDLGKTPSQPPDQVPLPESRAASVIGGVYDQPEPRNILRDNLRFSADKASSEIGVGPAKSLAPLFATESAKNQSTSRSWVGSAASWTRSKLKNPVDPDADAPETLPEDTQRKPDEGGAAQGSESQIPTPAQVDPPASILTQRGDTPPLLSTEPAQLQKLQEPQTSKLDPPPIVDAGVDSSPAPFQGRADKGDTAGLRKTSLFDLPTPSRTPPPPFSEFAGVPDNLAAGEAPAGQDPLTQDEAPTELTEEQKAVEEKRLAFLLAQVQELEGSRADLQRKLDREDDVKSRPAKAIESDLEDTEKTLNAVKTRMAKEKFSEPPPSVSIPEVTLINKSFTEVQFAITSAILDMLLAREDVEPMSIQVIISKQKSLSRKANVSKDALIAFAKRYKFATRFENGTPGTIDITF